MFKHLSRDRIYQQLGCPSAIDTIFPDATETRTSKTMKQNREIRNRLKEAQQQRTASQTIKEQQSPYSGIFGTNTSFKLLVHKQSQLFLTKAFFQIGKRLSDLFNRFPLLNNNIKAKPSNALMQGLNCT